MEKKDTENMEMKKPEEQAKPKKKKFIVVHNPENSRDRKSPERRPAQPKTQAAKPTQRPAAAPKAAAPAGGAGNVKIEAGAAGKVFKIEASVGQAVKKGDAVLVLEIMKMETPVVAPQDGTVASINVNVGDMVEAGALLATLN